MFLTFVGWGFIIATFREVEAEEEIRRERRGQGQCVGSGGRATTEILESTSGLERLCTTSGGWCQGYD
jgi:hypothetical protein